MLITPTDRFDRQSRIEGWNQTALRDARVLLVGAGTTGNEIAKTLALIGIGSCDIVDNDVVEAVNLSRCMMFRPEDIGQQKATVLADRVRPLSADYANFEAVNLNIVDGFGSGRYRHYSAVICAVDNLEARVWLNRYCRLNGITLIDTGIGGLNWQVTLVPATARACLECGWGASEYSHLAESHSCSKLGLPSHAAIIPMVVTTAAQAGGLAVELLARVLHGDVVDTGVKTWSRQGKYDSWLTWTTPPKKDCVAHRWERLSAAPLAGVLTVTVRHLAEFVRSALGAEAVEFSLDRPVVFAARCRSCAAAAPAFRPVPFSTFRRSVCGSCGQWEVVPSQQSEVLPENVTPCEVGIPTEHYLRVSWASNDIVREAWMLLR